MLPKRPNEQLNVPKSAVKEHQDILPEVLVDRYHDMAQYAALHGWKEWMQEVCEFNVVAIKLAEFFHRRLETSGIQELKENKALYTQQLDELKTAFRSYYEKEAREFLASIILPTREESRASGPTGLFGEEPLKLKRLLGRAAGTSREQNIFDSDFYAEAYGKYFQLLYIRVLSEHFSDHAPAWYAVAMQSHLEGRIRITNAFIENALRDERYDTNWQEVLHSAAEHMKIQNEEFAKALLSGSMRA